MLQIAGHQIGILCFALLHRHFIKYNIFWVRQLQHELVCVCKNSTGADILQKITDDTLRQMKLWTQKHLLVLV